MKKYEKIIKQLQKEYDQLKEYVETKTSVINDSKKQRIDSLLEKTNNAINSTINKIKELSNSKVNEKEFNQFLNKVVEKATEAIDFAKAKVNEIIDEEENLDEVFDYICEEFEKAKKTEVFKKASNIVKEIGVSVNEFLEKPEVQETINKAKVTTLNLAEKGLDGLKKVLNTDEETSVDDIVEEVDDENKDD